LCAAGFGAPQVRQRLYWVGVADCLGSPSRLSGSHARQEGDARVVDDSSRQELPRERERERASRSLAGAVLRRGTGRTRPE
jgi:site-specific DNA-cytosine methylase